MKYIIIGSLLALSTLTGEAIKNDSMPDDPVLTEISMATKGISTGILAMGSALFSFHTLRVLYSRVNEIDNFSDIVHEPKELFLFVKQNFVATALVYLAFKAGKASVISLRDLMRKRKNKC